MLTRTRFLAIVLLGVLPTLAQAQFWAGKQLKEGLDSEDGAPLQVMAAGYVVGVTDALDDWIFCLPGGPEGIRLRDVVDVVHGYLGANPDQLTKPAPRVIVNALQAKWPCKARPEDKPAKKKPGPKPKPKPEDVSPF